MTSRTVSLEALASLSTRVLRAAGASDDVASEVAAALVKADAQGLGSHGVSRLPFYAAQVRSGKVDGGAIPVAEQAAPGCVRVDARAGFAFPAIRLALDTAIEQSTTTGVAVAAVANSHHAGALGHAVDYAASRGVIALAFSNSPAGIAPFGGSRGVFGTNPIAFGCPRGAGHDPLVVDLSLSKVARGKVMQAQQRGESIPEGWAVDDQGRPTTDPQAALAGTMLPIGDAKGAALALVVEILSACLSGSRLGFEAGSFFTPDGPPPAIGQSFIVIRPDAFGAERFTERVEALLAAIVEQPDCRIPGERRRETEAAAARDGVRLDEELLRTLEGLTTP